MTILSINKTTDYMCIERNGSIPVWNYIIVGLRRIRLFYFVFVYNKRNTLCVRYRCVAWVVGKDFSVKSTRFLVEAAVITALYAALTILIPGGSGQIQVRVSEALTILPFLTPAAIPGLFVGCLLANMVIGAGLYDVIFGSLATLLAAYITSKMPGKYLAPLPPVIINAVVVSVILKLSLNLPILPSMGFVAVGETIACYVLGYPLLLLLYKQRHRIFSTDI